MTKDDAQAGAYILGALVSVWAVFWLGSVILTKEMRWWSFPAAASILVAGFAVFAVVVILCEALWKRFSQNGGGKP